MQKLFHQYITLHSKLKSKGTDTAEIANILNISEETARVIISRMLGEYMLYSPSRGTYKIVKPSLWASLKELSSSEYISRIKDFIGDLVQYSEHIKAIILHGSRIRGDYKIESDWDILVLSDPSDTSLQQLKNKYDYPVSIEVQPIEVYDKIYVQEAIKEGEIIYYDGEEDLKRKILKNEIKKEDIETKLDEIQKILFRLDDEKLFESLSVKDIAYVLYSALRSLEYIEKSMEIKKELKIKPHIIQETKSLYSASKSRTPIIPNITRKELSKLRTALTDKWAYLKAINESESKK